MLALRVALVAALALLALQFTPLYANDAELLPQPLVSERGAVDACAPTQLVGAASGSVSTSLVRALQVQADASSRRLLAVSKSPLSPKKKSPPPPPPKKKPPPPPPKPSPPPPKPLPPCSVVLPSGVVQTYVHCYSHTQAGVGLQTFYRAYANGTISMAVKCVRACVRWCAVFS